LRRATPKAKSRGRLAAVGLRRPCARFNRKRQISGQLTGRLVQRERRRRCGSIATRSRSTSAREADGIAVRFIGADGLPGNPHQLSRPGAGPSRLAPAPIDKMNYQ